MCTRVNFDVHHLTSPHQTSAINAHAKSDVAMSARPQRCVLNPSSCLREAVC